MLEATLLALGSAVLHAGWNLLVKTSDERFLTAWGQFVVGGVLLLPVLVFTGLPDSAAIPFLVASSLVHVAYVAALVRAYHHADFSFAYPIARGGGALLAAIGGVVFLSDQLSALSWLAIAIVVVGLASFVRPSVGLLAIGWALLTALTIGTYTTLDAAGARRTESGLAYGIVLVAAVALTTSVAGVAIGRGHDFVHYLRTTQRRAHRRRRPRRGHRVLDGAGRRAPRARRLRRVAPGVVRGARRRRGMAPAARAPRADARGVVARRRHRPRAPDRLPLTALDASLTLIYDVERRIHRMLAVPVSRGS